MEIFAGLGALHPRTNRQIESNMPDHALATWQFHSITRAQLDRTFKALYVGPDKNGYIEGQTPKGLIRGQISFNERDGVITCILLEKPGYSLQAIEYAILAMLANNSHPLSLNG